MCLCACCVLAVCWLCAGSVAAVRAVVPTSASILCHARLGCQFIFGVGLWPSLEPRLCLLKLFLHFSQKFWEIGES